MQQSPPPIPDATTKKRFSVWSLIDSFEAAVKSFPAATVYICLNSLWLIAYVLLPSAAISRDIETACNFVLPLGCMLSTAISVWSRYLGSKSRSEIIAQLIAAAILICDWFLLANHFKHLSTSIICGQGAAMTAAAIACLFVPDAKAMNQEQALNFTNNQIKNCLITGGLSIALAVVVTVIFQTISALFDVDTEKINLVLVIICSQAICSFIFLSRISTPEQNALQATTLSASRFRRGLTKFILLPASAIYMGVLYVYALKVTLAWSLPNGFITTSVTWLSALVFLTLYELKVSKPLEAGLTFKIYRWLPLLMMPLLLLMSVAIWYRLAEYGSTPSRLYVAAFNLWAFGVFIYLTLSRNFGKLNNVALSFAAVFLLTSIVPYFNLTDIAYRQQRNSVKEAFASVGVTKLPLNEDEFIEATDKMDPKLKKQVGERLYYLDGYDDHSRVSDIISFQAPYPYSEPTIDLVRNLKFESYNQFLTIPEGYSSVNYFQDSKYEAGLDSSNPVVVFTVGDSDSISISLEMNRLKLLSDKKTLPDTLIQTSNSQVAFRPTQIDFTIYDTDKDTNVSIRTCRGYLFKK